MGRCICSGIRVCRIVIIRYKTGSRGGQLNKRSVIIADNVHRDREEACRNIGAGYDDLITVSRKDDFIRICDKADMNAFFNRKHCKPNGRSVLAQYTVDAECQMLANTEYIFRAVIGGAVPYILILRSVRIGISFFSLAYACR